MVLRTLFSRFQPIMYVALTYDHRLIDGREAVLFLKKIKSVRSSSPVFLLTPHSLRLSRTPT